MLFLETRTAEWRVNGGRLLGQAANERRPILFYRTDTPTFILFPIPFMHKTELLAELRRLDLIRVSFYKGAKEDPIPTDITKPLPEIEANWIRREMLRLRTEITWSLTPKCFTKYGITVALLLPIPHDMDLAVVHKIAEEFYS